MTINPFDLRTVLLARHAQHVVLIHFPIALCLAGFLLDVAADWTGRNELSSAAYWNLTLAALSAVPAAVSGLLAWHFELEGRSIRGILLWHLLAGCASAILIITTWYLHDRQRRTPNSIILRYRWPVQLATALAVTITGHLGGFLSGVNHP